MPQDIQNVLVSAGQGVKRAGVGGGGGQRWEALNQASSMTNIAARVRLAADSFRAMIEYSLCRSFKHGIFKQTDVM